MNTRLLADIYNPVTGELGTGGDGGSAIATLMGRLFITALTIGGLALLLYLAWGGLSWLTAGSDKAKVEEARSRITNAIIGMAFLVATVAIVLVLNTIFGFDLLSPTLPSL